MHRATRALIADRLRDAGAVLTVSSVRRVPQFEPTNCLSNSAKAMSIDVLGSGSTNNPCVAGWLVTAFDPKLGHAPIVQHWWNRDPILGVEFDTTPLHPDTIAGRPEYVSDPDYYEVGMREQRKRKLATGVGRDLAYKDDAWFEFVDDVDGMYHLEPMPSLKTTALFFYGPPQ